MIDITEVEALPRPSGATGPRRLDGRLGEAPPAPPQFLCGCRHRPSDLIPKSQGARCGATRTRAPRQRTDIRPAKERSGTVTDDDPSHLENRNAHDGSEGAVRKPRAIRFSDSEWDEVKKAAEDRGVPVAEYVRETMRDHTGYGPQPRCGRLARDSGRPRAADRADIPLHLDACNPQARRTDPNGGGEEMEKLVKAARELQDHLQHGGSN